MMKRAADIRNILNRDHDQDLIHENSIITMKNEVKSEAKSEVKSTIARNMERAERKTLRVAKEADPDTDIISTKI